MRITTMYFSFFMFIFICLSSCTSCSNGVRKSNLIDGTWIGSDDINGKNQIIFNNGVFLGRTLKDNGNWENVMSGKYSIDGEKLIVSVSSSEIDKVQNNAVFIWKIEKIDSSLFIIDPSRPTGQKWIKQVN